MLLHVSVILFTGGGSTSGGLSVQGGLCPGGSLSWGSLCPGEVSVGGVSLSWRPPTVISGRFASYWNAFSLIFMKPVRVKVMVAHQAKVKAIHHAKIQVAP